MELKNVYPTEKEVLYKFRKYVVGHDGLTNESDLIASLEDISNLISQYTDKYTWESNPWESTRNLSVEFYRDKASQSRNVKTRVTALLKEAGYDVITNYQNTGKEARIYNYVPSGKVIVEVEAGSKSCFDSSDRLSAQCLFYSFSASSVHEFIVDENVRIVANVKPDADLRLAEKQLFEARHNAMIANN